MKDKSTKEQELKEAAKKELDKAFYEHSFEDADRELTTKPYKAVIDGMVNLVKSEAAKQYHSPNVSVIYLNNLRRRFQRRFDFFSTKDKFVIWDFFLPHLNQPKESDAVEFAEWCEIKGYMFQESDKRWFGSNGYLVATTTKELYQQFLNR